MEVVVLVVVQGIVQVHAILVALEDVVSHVVDIVIILVDVDVVLLVEVAVKEHVKLIVGMVVQVVKAHALKLAQVDVAECVQKIVHIIAKQFVKRGVKEAVKWYVLVTVRVYVDQAALVIVKVVVEDFHVELIVIMDVRSPVKDIVEKKSL